MRMDVAVNQELFEGLLQLLKDLQPAYGTVELLSICFVM